MVLNKDLIIRLFAPGLGDLVVQHGMFRTLAEDGYRLTVWCKSQSQVDLLKRSPWVEESIFVPEGTEDALLSFGYWRGRIIEGATYFDQAATEIESKYVWGGEEFISEFGPIHITEILDLMYGAESRYRYEDTPFITNHDGKRHEARVLIAPGGRRQTKLWPTDKWATLIENLQKMGLQPTIIGNKNHKGSGQVGELVDRYGFPFAQAYTMGKVVDLISSSKALVGIDSGLVHLAAAQGTETIALFGPIQSWLWGPRTSIIYEGWPDCPGRKDCITKPMDWKCGGEYNGGCMGSLNPETITRLVASLYL